MPATDPHPDPIPLEYRPGVLDAWADVLTGDVRDALAALAPFDDRRRALMRERDARRRERFAARRPLAFLDPDAVIPGTTIRVRDAREGRFRGADIPRALERQWIQGTGPATRPGAPPEVGLRNVAYALLSGADGWMFDGEDALGQRGTMALENQRNLRLALHADPRFLRVAERVADEMNAWSREALGRDIVRHWRAQLEFTTRIFRPRGLHLDDRHVRRADGAGFSASLVDLCTYTVNNHRVLLESGQPVVLYLPKIQTAAEAALWDAMLSALERHLGLSEGDIRVYVLVEQIEAAFQLMEIRAALGRHFVGFNTGRWDYIHSVADAMAWDDEFVDPDIDAITMTWGYMRAYEDRVRRACNTPDADGRFVLWQGGMEPNIPVGSPEGVRDGMARAVSGARRERDAGASGKWVAHWKMVHIVRPVWEEAGEDNQMGRLFAPLSYDDAAARALRRREDAPRTPRGARALLSVALQYANAFLQGYQAAALKSAETFGNPDVLYLMEDMATCEIRVGILWEWLHKGARFTEGDAEAGIAAGEVFDAACFERMLRQEMDRLLGASDRDVHDDSKRTTLPIAREAVRALVTAPEKLPWTIDVLNACLDLDAVAAARPRIDACVASWCERGERLTAPLDFVRLGTGAREGAP